MRLSRESMALRIGLYRKCFSSHTKMRKLSIWAPTVNQSMSMDHFPPAWAMTCVQNGLAKMRIIDTTKQ